VADLLGNLNGDDDRPRRADRCSRKSSRIAMSHGCLRDLITGRRHLSGQ